MVTMIKKPLQFIMVALAGWENRVILDSKDGSG